MILNGISLEENLTERLFKMNSLEELLLTTPQKIGKRLRHKKDIGGKLNDNYLIGNKESGEEYILRVPKKDPRDVLEEIRKEYEGIGYVTNGNEYRFRNLGEQVSFINLCKQKNIPVADIVDVDKNYMLSEFVKGIDLPNFLRKQKKRRGYMLNINTLVFNTYLSSLVSAHQEGIVLGDRWGPNTIVTPQINIIHIDFDIELTAEDAREFELAQGTYYCLLHSKNKGEVVDKLKDFFKRKEVISLYDRTRVSEFLTGHSQYFKAHKEYGGIESEIDCLSNALKPKAKATSSSTEEEKNTIFICKNKRYRLPLHQEVAKPDHYSQFLAEHIIPAERLWRKALDICMGGGVHIIILAEKGFTRIDGIDINQKAVHLVKELIHSKDLKDIKDSIKIYHGEFPEDFQHLSETYNLIITDPPQIPTPPNLSTLQNLSREEKVFYYTNEGGFDGRQVVDKIIRAVPEFLKDNSYFQIVHADFIGIEKTCDLFKKVGLESTITATQKVRPGPLTTSRIDYIESLGYKFQKDNEGPYFDLAVITGKKEEVKND